MGAIFSRGGASPSPDSRGGCRHMSCPVQASRLAVITGREAAVARCLGQDRVRVYICLHTEVAAHLRGSRIPGKMRKWKELGGRALRGNAFLPRRGDET